MGTLGGEGLMEVDGAGRLQNPSAETTGLKVDDDGRFLLGPPTLFDLGNERFRCVETGHEMPAKDTESYARSKACRVALIDAALSKNKTPLNMFHQPHPVSKSKLVCKLTGDTINKSEEHIWKHINGKRFLHRLEQKEVEELASRKPLKENMIAVKKDRNKNFDADGSMARKPTSHISASEVPEFLIPPVKSHCDFDDREDRWESCTSSVLETNDDMEIDGADRRDGV